MFASTAQYTSTFKFPLIEETRASLCSGMESVGSAPACEITRIEWSKDYKPPKEFYYNILTKKISDFKNNGGHYDPEVGDLIVLSNTKPRRVDDLQKPGVPFTVALVTSSEDGSDMTRILLSKGIDDSSLKPMPYKQIRVFATYLNNLITNIRIWKALNPDPQGLNMFLSLKVLMVNSNVSCVFIRFLAEFQETLHYALTFNSDLYCFVCVCRQARTAVYVFLKRT